MHDRSIRNWQPEFGNDMRFEGIRVSDCDVQLTEALDSVPARHYTGMFRAFMGFVGAGKECTFQTKINVHRMLW